MARRVQVEVRRQLQELAGEIRESRKSAAAEPAAAAPAAKPARSHKARDRKPKLEPLELWRERARILGLDDPMPHPSHPESVDGRWLRRVRPQWEARAAVEQS